MDPEWKPLYLVYSSSWLRRRKSAASTAKLHRHSHSHVRIWINTALNACNRHCSMRLPLAYFHALRVLLSDMNHSLEMRINRALLPNCPSFDRQMLSRREADSRRIGAARCFRYFDVHLRRRDFYRRVNIKMLFGSFCPAVYTVKVSVLQSEESASR